ncbi:hypothetical protein [Streptomyces sp. NPDC050504]|uniref:SCO2583 family membrane protein n=1 Tax=Streptomyces sp. NPDC050504 TaxID=3365618 RepID=UPI0037AD910C
MAGRADPPEGTPDGTPEGLPGGGDDEYRSVVFDESFVRAARLQEFSAQERMGDHARAVRSRPAGNIARSFSRQALILILLVCLAFGTAVYLGVRHPYEAPPRHRAEPAVLTVVPLAPAGAVPGGTPDDLFAHSPAAQFRTGAAGINLPPTRRTEHFSESQIVTAMTTVKDYLVESSLDPDVLTGDTVRQVRVLLDPDQTEQFDRSIGTPRGDGRHSATGWLVRFDPSKVVLADSRIRVQGTLRFAEAGRDVLEVTADHTYVYALRPTGATSSAGASLFAVRRELRFTFDRDDLRMHRVELASAYVRAGPQACSSDAAGRLRPLLAGQRAGAGGPAGTDPYATGGTTEAVCGTLARGAQPTLGGAPGS